LTLVDGFFMDGDKPMYQGLCTLKDYMSFFVDV
jgi:hypothetical protein